MCGSSAPASALPKRDDRVSLSLLYIAHKGWLAARERVCSCTCDKEATRVSWSSSRPASNIGSADSRNAAKVSPAGCCICSFAAESGDIHVPVHKSDLIIAFECRRAISKQAFGEATPRPRASQAAL